ncbi:MAG: hypothetical protein PF961_12590, partial [Planctomycetota bacterium]|nr:hypothetical protein [Planctomycetota bacterium]
MNVASLNQVGGHIASVAARQRHPLVLLWRMLGLRWWQQAFLVVMLALKNMADWAWPVAVAAGIALLE